MGTDEETLMQELMQTFQVEAAEHLQSLNRILLKLEREVDEARIKAFIQEAFRLAHSLKGAARAVELRDIETLAHAMEDILKAARDQGLVLAPNICDTLYAALDAMNHLLDNKPIAIADYIERLQSCLPTTSVRQPQPQPDTLQNLNMAVPQPRDMLEISDNDETLRVPVMRLDALMAQTGELLVTRGSLGMQVSALQELQQQMAHWTQQWQEVQTMVKRSQQHPDTARKLDERLDQLTTHWQKAHQLITQLEHRANHDALRLNLITNRLQDELRHTRMMPFNALETLLTRTVRDAAYSEHKPVRFTLQGGTVTLDKKVLEVLKDPLMHLLRNAVVHGIETPDQRKAQNKPAEGTIRIEVLQRGSEAHITVSDDGQGFDIAAIQQAANQQRDTQLTSDDVLNLAFLPGVTTHTHVTPLAGRGVGLDVVRRQVEGMQGRIVVQNVVGQGASICLIVPVSLALTRVLLVAAGEHRFALPLANVEKIATPERAYPIEGYTLMTIDGIPMPVIPLVVLLGLDSILTTPEYVVVIGAGQQRIGLLVDDVLTEQELAVRPLGKPVIRLRYLAGAALPDGGDPVVILNVADILKATRVAHHNNTLLTMTPPLETVVQSVKHILVVDDSITTRTLEKNILEAAGFAVVTAIDGLEALQRLKQQSVELIVADVEMPNMDGITLTRTLRDTHDYAEMPIILVTSLETNEDRERGLAAGANAYIVKRGFNQAELLTTIRQLL